MNNICGAITISGAHVTAIRGSGAPYCIGKGAADTQNSTRTCGTITIGGVVTNRIEQSPFVTYPYNRKNELYTFLK